MSWRVGIHFIALAHKRKQRISCKLHLSVNSSRNKWCSPEDYRVEFCLVVLVLCTPPQELLGNNNMIRQQDAMMESYFFNLFARILYFPLSQKVKSKQKMVKILPVTQTPSLCLALMVLFVTENRSMDGMVDRWIEGTFYFHKFKGTQLTCPERSAGLWSWADRFIISFDLNQWRGWKIKSKYEPTTLSIGGYNMTFIGITPLKIWDRITNLQTGRGWITGRSTGVGVGGCIWTVGAPFWSSSTKEW